MRVNDTIIEGQHIVVIYFKSYIPPILPKCTVSYHCELFHDEDIKWKHFSRYWPFVCVIRDKLPRVTELPL